MKILLASFLFVTLITPFTVASASADGDSQQKNPGVSSLEKALATRLPSLKIDSVTATPVDGLYQVVVGSQVVYMDKNAEYMLDGDMVNLRTRENYSENAKSVIRLNAINQLGEKNMLVYRPEKVEHVITVITDINCPYCRRLHSEIDQYMKSNVEVRYIFMPLKGPDDKRKTESVWCADDPQKALDMAKAGGKIEERKCDNPLDEQMATARKLGVRGTPAIILESGEMLPGYIPADKLVAELNKTNVSSSK